MLTRPLPSTPQVTGDACGLPSERVVIRMARCRGRANSSIPARSTRVLVAICGDMPASLRRVAARSGDGLAAPPGGHCWGRCLCPGPATLLGAGDPARGPGPMRHANDL